MAIMIGSLDQGNTLYLHPNDSNYAYIVPLKLTSVDNYRIWASAIRLALQIKHKMGFINGTCVRSTYAASALLFEQWDRCNAVVLNWILSSLSQDVYLGNFFFDNAANVWNELRDTHDRVDGSISQMGLDDVYQPIRSSILTREILPKAKDAFVIISKEESQRGIPTSFVKSQTDKAQSSAFVSKTNNCGLKGHTINRCFEIIGYPPGFKRNPNLKPSGSFNYNKANFSNTKGNNDVKTSSGSVSLTNDQVIKLMSLLNDKGGSSANSHMAEKVLGTSRESASLYLFDSDYASSAMCSDSKFFVCRVSKDVWHNKLGHPANQSTSFGELIHLDVWGPFKVISMEAFRLLSSVLNGKSPFSLVYSREPNLSHLRSFGCLCFVTVVKGSDKFSHRSEKYVLIGYASDQPRHDETHPITPIDEHINSEGNVVTSDEVLIFQIDFPNTTKEVSLRKSQRTSKFPAKLNEYVLDNKFKPDISYSMHCLSQHMHASLKSHFDIALRVLKYLELAPGLGVEFVKRNNECVVTAYSDSDWAKCLINRRSISGYCVFKILEEFGIDNIVPAELFCDNKSSIQIATNPVMHEKTKHFDIDVHLVREKVASSLIKIVKVDTKSQVADILTKALGSYQHSFLVKKLGLLNMFVA
ncbi:ribonuclease H-like domain-containing protein [Tanacetum coccineum]|uniref:Ribonuclease H-like domain-containing protein n=1 Tax=Tanacetum coccineum TaxID=301880 RepID=A0ABQ4ZNW9_9ASTR